MNKSEDISALSKALIKTQSEMPEIKKDKENPYYKSKYADLSTIVKISTPVLSNNGLSISQFPVSSEMGAGVRTMLLHETGQYIEDVFLLRPSDNKAQTIASCVTYARRYSWQSVLGIVADDDDDGNAASGKLEEKKGYSKPTVDKKPKMELTQLISKNKMDEHDVIRKLVACKKAALNTETIWDLDMEVVQEIIDNFNEFKKEYDKDHEIPFD